MVLRGETSNSSQFQLLMQDSPKPLIDNSGVNPCQLPFSFDRNRKDSARCIQVEQVLAGAATDQIFMKRDFQKQQVAGCLYTVVLSKPIHASYGS
ncbi:hypothetical protein QYF36_013956 [Acer negundo]|nr:hypothetical protein QYF36_013956 [Acer negundo]